MIIAKMDIVLANEEKQTTNKLNSYINIIRNPETLKQAVVMSEVLKRKF